MITNKLKQIYQFITKSFIAGVFISIGAAAFLSIGMPFGPVVFAFGLISVILTNSCLFTGKAGFTTTYWELIPMIILNAVGCYVTASLFNFDVTNIINARLTTPYWILFGKSVLTGIIMTVSVSYAKSQNNWLPLLFGIPTFIMIGLPHCIADCFYYAVYGLQESFLIPWLISVGGNFVGCNFHRILKI